MPLTASLDGNASSFPPPSPSPGGGDPNDPSHSLPSFAFVIYQLSVLISTLGSTAADTFTRYQLLAAFSNVLSTSINLREVPSSITADGAVHVAAAVAPASSVTSPIPEPPHTPTPPPLPRSNTPSQSPSLTIRVLTPVQPLTPPPRRSRRKRRPNRSRSCPSSPAAGPGSPRPASPTCSAPLADEAMEVKEADASDDGYRATTLSHSAKPSSESVMPPSVSAPQLNPAPHSTAPLRADEAMEVKEVNASDDGHRATTLFHSARPSSESAVPPSAPQADSPPPAMLPTTTESSDLLESSVSSPPAPSETKEASSADQPRRVVTTPFSSPNPFALLDVDCKEKVAPMDVRRASIPVPSACSSSVATASRAHSKMDAEFNYMAARIRKPKPVVTVDESTVTKRPCTRAHPATASTHGFFQRLATRSGAVRAHFEKHYLSTSRMCPCDLFPVYASKVEGVPTLPPELNAFCLQCISANVVSIGAPLVMALGSWAPGFMAEMQAYYLPCYDKREREKLEKLATEMEKEDRERRWGCLLERMGFVDRA